MKVTEAVKTLRLHLGDTQQSFATRLGLAISTAVRYESTRAPRGRALAQLYDVAKQHGCDAAAQVFHGALAKEMGGIPVPHTFSLPAGISPEEIHPQTSDEARLVAALLHAIRDHAGEKEVEKIAQILKSRYAKFWNLDLEVRKS
jgi:transcriptional regulator with XRE-family HTH domain